ncbi:MAG: hypothetical protein ABDK87_04435 [Atribacterota bacterium]
MTKWYALCIIFLFLFLLLSPEVIASVRKLPSFYLYTLRGEEMLFRPVASSLLFFLDPGCLSCLTDLLNLLKGLEGLKEAISLYVVCLRCDFRDAQNLEDSLGGRHTVYLAHPELPALLGIWKTPAVFLVNREGRVLYQEKGTISWETLWSSLPSKTRQRSSKERQTTCALESCS